MYPSLYICINERCKHRFLWANPLSSFYGRGKKKNYCNSQNVRTRNGLWWLCDDDDDENENNGSKDDDSSRYGGVEMKE